MSIPNIGHWYGRLKVGFGLFSYDRRGLFDSGHLRFFTRVNFQRIAAVEQLEIVRFSATSTPLVNVLSRGMESPEQRTLSRGVVCVSSRRLCPASAREPSAFWPTLFGYQLLFELPAPGSRQPEVVRLTRSRPAGAQRVPGLSRRRERAPDVQARGQQLAGDRDQDVADRKA